MAATRKSDWTKTLPFATIEWKGGIEGSARLLDQTRLPAEVVYIDCNELEQMWEAIRTLRVRGAPAIGIAAAMGVVLGIRRSRATTRAAFIADLKKVTKRLGESRPTAVNLFWALRRMGETALRHREMSVPQLKQTLLDEAVTILEEDRATCRAIGENGARLFKDGATVLTHCNAGALATGGCGTALAAIYAAHAHGKTIRVFAKETRPLLQGARLTTWELSQAGIDVTLICDSSVAHVMREKHIDAVIVGADRIAANGDVANKIGTYTVAICAKELGVPFYVAAPVSSFDPKLSHGGLIPIEERAGSEVECFLESRAAPAGIRILNPAFDVTPASYVSAIITERGIIERPTTAKVRAHLRT